MVKELLGTKDEGSNEFPLKDEQKIYGGYQVFEFA